MTSRAVGNERLRTLYAVIAGIPENVIDLSDWRFSEEHKCYVSDDNLYASMESPNHSCGATACAVGYACAFPEFKQAGLGFDKNGGFPIYRGKQNWEAVNKFFGLRAENGDSGEAGDIFYGYKGDLDSDDYYDLTDKQRVLARLRRHLLAEGIITAERNAELATKEGTQA